MKKIFLCILFGLILIAIFFKWHRVKEAQEMKLKVSWYSDMSLDKHDPANIQFAAPAVLLMNLYSSLLIYNQNSEISPGLIESFSWVGESEVKFKFKQGLLSSKGDIITAKDAYLSFKRLLVKQMNTHGDLQNFLCPNINLKSIEDDCPGLRLVGDELYLKAADPNFAKFLIPLIANCDFGIIPQNAVDWKSPDLKIIDYENTSGPYFVRSTNAKGEHILWANKNSPLYNPNMPQIVEIIPVMDNSSPIKLKSGVVDMITTIDRARPEDMLQFKSDSKFNLHMTSGLEVTKLQFTSKGQSLLNEKERIALGGFIKGIITKSWPKETVFEETNQFFPAFGEASLNESQLKLIKDLFSQNNVVPNKKIRISVEGYRLEEFKKLFSDYEFIEFIKFSGRPSLKKYDDMEDGYIVPGDTGFVENISLISYYMNIGAFGYNDKVQANKWIQEYVKIDDKNLRLEMLRQIHFDALAKGIIVPIAITPYFAAATSDWRLDLHRHFAGTPLWMIRKD